IALILFVIIPPPPLSTLFPYTTLFRSLTISPKAVFGAYEQMDYQFTNDDSVLGFMKGRSDYDEGKIRAVLHSMGFIGNDLKKNVRDLSGGEAIRLVLCQ